jgi:hypothetical protein
MIYRRISCLFTATALILILLSYACAEKTPAGILEPDKIAEILAHTMLLTIKSDSTVQQQPADSSAAVRVILRRYEISYERFSKSLEHYQGHNNIWIHILEKTATILEKARDSEIDSDTTLK